MDIYERKLMLVDDNQELLEMIADILRHSGYKNIVKAKCVQEALTVFQMEKPDMAVLDVMLPDGCLLYTSLDFPLCGSDKSQKHF